MSGFKPSRKVFDISNPGNTPANPSSKPIIISNKPEIEDPMVANRNEPTNSIPSINDQPIQSTIIQKEQVNEDATEQVSPTENVEVKEDKPNQPKPKKKTNPLIVVVLLILIALVVVHALINFGVVHVSLSSLKLK